MANIPGANNILPDSPLTGTSESTAGVTGKSNRGPGVLGESLGSSGTGPGGTVVAAFPPSDGVLGNGMNGVRGVSDAAYGTGTSPAGAGVWGTNTGSGPGVYGTSATGDGVLGNAYHGVHGQSSSEGGAGVWGENTGSGSGVSGTSSKGDGVLGAGYHGVHGRSGSAGGAGVWGEDTGSGVGVSGSSTAKQGVSGLTSTGVAIYGKSSGPGLAGQFDGSVKISGTVTAADVLLSGADCAEDFAVASARDPEPGTVVVFDGEGAISECVQPYDKRVAGVISGAGPYRPAVIFGRSGSTAGGKAPVALIGRVYCKVDTSFSPIEVGDLLTTSPTPGFAMKASDPDRAFGAVIGKALAGMERGSGMIPILVALQ
jgi:hypothetical protein